MARKPFEVFSLLQHTITSMQFGYLNAFNLFCAMDAFYKLWVINLVSGAFIIA